MGRIHKDSWIEQRKNRFVEKVPYITSSGFGVTSMVSQYGIFEKPLGLKELELTTYFADPAAESEEKALRTIQEQCGWPPKIRRPLRVFPSPSSEHLNSFVVSTPNACSSAG
jgi:hypothetical protein